jgi:hypothetical protein
MKSTNVEMKYLNKIYIPNGLFLFYFTCVMISSSSNHIIQSPSESTSPYLNKTLNKTGSLDDEGPALIKGYRRRLFIMTVIIRRVFETWLILHRPLLFSRFARVPELVSFQFDIYLFGTILAISAFHCRC